MGLSVLLVGITGAVLAGVSDSVNVTRSDAEQDAGTIGVVAAIVLLAVLLIGYYCGGYVAGRMSRFDGAKQGLGVWVIGLAVTIVAGLLGWIFGSQYNVLDRVDLPNIPIRDNAIGWGTAITAAAVIVGTILAAVLGGVLGQRYHHRVDRAAAHDA